MKSKEKRNPYRTYSILAIVLVTLGITVFLCVSRRLGPEEWICLLLVDAVFLAIFIFRLEFDRRKERLANNTQSSFVKIAWLYSACALLVIGMSFLPDFTKPVILVPLLLCAASNAVVAVMGGLFFDLLLVLACGGSLHVMLAFLFMTLFGAVLSEALVERAYRLPAALILSLLNLLIPGIFSYWEFREGDAEGLLYGLGSGVLTGLVAFFLFPLIRRVCEQEMDKLYVSLVSENFSKVKNLREYSPDEYRYARKVSEIAFRCAKVVGCDPNLCRAAAFYYNMSSWPGEPYQVDVKIATRLLCFPERLTRILMEYHGEKAKPSSPESALVHMVDALNKKMELFDRNEGDSQWDRNMLIYQALNEYSGSGLYDQSGLSMNQFLLARGYLASKGVL